SAGRPDAQLVAARVEELETPAAWELEGVDHDGSSRGAHRGERRVEVLGVQQDERSAARSARRLGEAQPASLVAARLRRRLDTGVARPVGDEGPAERRTVELLRGREVRDGDLDVVDRVMDAVRVGAHAATLPRAPDNDGATH